MQAPWSWNSQPLIYGIFLIVAQIDYDRDQRLPTTDLGVSAIVEAQSTGRDGRTQAGLSGEVEQQESDKQGMPDTGS